MANRSWCELILIGTWNQYHSSFACHIHVMKMQFPHTNDISNSILPSVFVNEALVKFKHEKNQLNVKTWNDIGTLSSDLFFSIKCFLTFAVVAKIWRFVWISQWSVVDDSWQIVNIFRSNQKRKTSTEIKNVHTTVVRQRRRGEIESKGKRVEVVSELPSLTWFWIATFSSSFDIW